MKEKKRNSLFGTSLTAFIGFAVTSIAVIAIPLILNAPAGRSEYFWSRIIWTEVLVTLIWLYLSGFIYLVLPKYRSQKGLGAVLPSLGVVIFVYAFSSFAIMVLAAYFPAFNTVNLVVQICLAAGSIVIVIFIHFSKVAGITGTDQIFDGVASPKELILQIKNQENSIASKSINNQGDGDIIATLNNSLKNLRETIAYSIPHVGRFGNSERYQVFSKKVSDLCSDCTEVIVKIDSGKIQTILQRSIKLKEEVKNIAQHIRHE